MNKLLGGLLVIVLAVESLVLAGTWRLQREVSHLGEGRPAQLTPVDHVSRNNEPPPVQTGPTGLPTDFGQRLTELESSLRQVSSWPQNAEAAKAMLARVQVLVSQVPPSAEQVVLPRLNAVRWGSYALVLITTADTIADETTDQLLNNIDTTIAVEPPTAFADVSTALREKREAVAKKRDAFRQKQAIAEAQSLIKNGGSSDEYADSLTKLSEWADAAETHEEVQGLRNSLNARALADETRAVISSVPNGVIQARTEPSPAARQVALANLLNTVVSQRQHVLARILELRPKTDVGLAKLSGQLAEQVKPIEDSMREENKIQEKLQEEQRAKSLRKYQEWALSEIQKCQRAIESHTGFRVPGGVVDQNDYKEVAEAIKKHLVPISIGYLDPAVARLFNETFEEGWKVLENSKGWQTWVAKQEAMVAKHLPE
jgi:hypothetical protein